MFFHMVYKSGQIFLPFCHNTRVWQTDGRTDGRTEFSSLDRVYIPCSAVKTLEAHFKFRHAVWKIRVRMAKKFSSRLVLIKNFLIDKSPKINFD